MAIASALLKWHSPTVNETSKEITLESLRAAREGQPIVVATVVGAPEDAPVTEGTKMLVRKDGTRLGTLNSAELDDAIAEDCLAALNEFPRRVVQAMYYRPEGNRIHRLEAREGPGAYEIMVEIIEAPVSLLVVGGGHIGLSLATVGAHVGFSVSVLDDREMYANPERFPMADHVLCGDIQEELDKFPIHSNTYIVMVSRGHKQDEIALRAVLNRGARYVGMIGSKRRVSTVLRHMYEEGFPLDVLEDVYTPIGFDIGAETPEEIAVSIMAEIIMVHRGGTGRQMRIGRPKIGEPVELEPEAAT